ncbi:uncharacterized protein LOC127553248 [Antechinus flavipes]|uniref:uncharacterized protein LOC127553248 n=1 Tax=Antechinus flavipes TaxID=38775 RepID=UPI0022364B0A|nr:uncharacterized protein LOC127553248 [Antechinus flavipes]
MQPERRLGGEGGAGGKGRVSRSPTSYRGHVPPTSLPPPPPCIRKPCNRGRVTQAPRGRGRGDGTEKHPGTFPPRHNAPFQKGRRILPCPGGRAEGHQTPSGLGGVSGLTRGAPAGRGRGSGKARPLLVGHAPGPACPASLPLGETSPTVVVLRWRPCLVLGPSLPKVAPGVPTNSRGEENHLPLPPVSLVELWGARMSPFPSLALGALPLCRTAFVTGVGGGEGRAPSRGSDHEAIGGS